MRKAINRQEHTNLKEYAHILLRNMGFNETEIKEEYTIKTSEMKEGFRVDVVGIKTDRKVAVECGLTNSNKLVWEKLFFDEVIVLPFFKMDTEAISYQRRIRELEQELAEASRNLEEGKKEQSILVADSEQLSVIYILIKSLISCFEGKSSALLGIWDHHLNSATDSLFNSLIYWRDSYEELKNAKKEKGTDRRASLIESLTEIAKEGPKQDARV